MLRLMTQGYKSPSTTIKRCFDSLGAPWPNGEPPEFLVGPVAGGAKAVDEFQKRSMTLGQIADLSRPVVHFYVDI